MHLTDAKGWSACSRWTLVAGPIEQLRFKVDDPWCGTCLARLADHAVRAITAFGLEGLKRREDRSPAKRKTACLWDATACRDIGVMIRSYIKGNAAPVGSKCVDNFEDLADRLERSGTEILTGLDDLDGGDA
jgi:hypothetical protein